MMLLAVGLALAFATPRPPQASKSAREQQGANDPTTRSPHGQLNITCQNCHTLSGWKPIRAVPEFDHSRTRYPLLGLHKSVACVECHTNPVFSNVGTRCVDCHADIHRRQNGAQCEQCHTVMGWNVSMKSVQQHTNRFPLVGAHATVDCESCHRGAATGMFQGLSTDCITCHTTDFMNATQPNHRTSGFPTDCRQCHSTMDNWLNAKFDHSTTGFALSGAHATLDCTSCHVGGKFQGTSPQCISCHQKDFNGTTNPAHASGGFPTTCAQCHSTTTWAGASFNHGAVTGFTLTGMHATLACTSCHVNGQFAGTPASCNGCHMTDFQGTNNPNHAAVGFPTDCALCHSTATWAGATFNHATTGFPLDGAHTSLACSTCHTSAAAPNPACVSCHLNDFNGTNSPPHAAAGFPQQCTLCHSTSSWLNATFNHSTTAFPLQGPHTTVPCASCHVNNNYTTLPTDCYGCHQADYTGTTNPNHAAAGFPTTCLTCHTTWQTTNWLGATFNHTWFPVPHHTAQLCTDCHTNSKDYSVFLCTQCHTQSQTAQQHQGVSGFVWNSVNCYACHKN